jgi:hypothetical protein
MQSNVIHLSTREEREAIGRRSARRATSRLPAGVTAEVLDFATHYLAGVLANAARIECGDMD